MEFRLFPVSRYRFGSAQELYFGSQAALHNTTDAFYNSVKCSPFGLMNRMCRPIYNFNYSIHELLSLIVFIHLHVLYESNTHPLHTRLPTNTTGKCGKRVEKRESERNCVCSERTQCKVINGRNRKKCSSLLVQHT